MPQANDGEEEWLCYTEAIKVASESLRHHRYPGRTREVGLQIGWEVHCLAMSVMEKGVWKKFPSLKTMVWKNLKNTVGFMEDMMQDVDNISSRSRAKWRIDYKTYIDARHEAEGRKNYGFKSEEPKRKLETIAMEGKSLQLKRQKTDNEGDMVKGGHRGEGLPKAVEINEEEEEEMETVGNDGRDWEEKKEEAGDKSLTSEFQRIREIFDSDSEEDEAESERDEKGADRVWDADQRFYLEHNHMRGLKTEVNGKETVVNLKAETDADLEHSYMGGLKMKDLKAETEVDLEQNHMGGLKTKDKGEETVVKLKAEAEVDDNLKAEDSDVNSKAEIMEREKKMQRLKDLVSDWDEEEAKSEVSKMKIDIKDPDTRGAVTLGPWRFQLPDEEEWGSCKVPTTWKEGETISAAGRRSAGRKRLRPQRGGNQ